MSKQLENTDSNGSVITLEALVVDVDCEPPRHFHRFNFMGATGTRVNIDVPSEMLRRRHEALRLLTQAGLPLGAPQEMDAELERALAFDQPKSIAVTRVSGWRTDVYVGHRRTFGQRAGEPSLLLRSGFGADDLLTASAGTAEAWRSGLKIPCSRSDYLTFAIALGFAGPMMGLVGENEGAIFHFAGQSSAGKSLSARACQSVFGAGDRIGNFNVTERAFEEECARRSDLVTIMDEGGQAGDTPEKVMKMIAFMLTGGAGKSRSMAVASSSLQNLRWRTLGFSTWELNLGSRIPGQEVRHININVPVLADGGIFNQMKSGDTSSALATRVEETIQKHHGVAFDGFLDALVAQRQGHREEAKRLIDEFVEKVAGGATSWDRRLARKFGIVYAGGVIATRLGATPWKSENRISNALRRIHRQVAKSGFNAEAAVKGLVQELRKAKREGALPNVEKGHALPEETVGALGFRRDHPHHGKCIMIPPDKLQSRWPQRDHFSAVIAVLKRRGILVGGAGGKDTIQVKIKGTVARSRYYVLLAKGVFASRKTPAAPTA